MYDPNQIAYDYTVEVTNRFKGLDLIECLKLWMEVHNIVRETVIKTIPKKKKCKKAKWLAEELREEEKRKAKEIRKDKHIYMQSSKKEQGEMRKPS